MMKYLWVDVESTGLMRYDAPAHAPGQPRVCAIGMLLLDHEFRIEEEIECLIKPDGWFLDPNSDAAKVNGLTMEELERDGVPILKPLRIYAQAIDEGRIVGGHNVSSDMKILRGELRRAKQEDRFMKTKSICTMRMAPRDVIGAVDKNGRLKAPRLDELCNHFGINAPGHRALKDARASFEAFNCMRGIGILPKITNPYDKPAKGSKRAKTKADDAEGGHSEDNSAGSGPLFDAGETAVGGE